MLAFDGEWMSWNERLRTPGPRHYQAMRFWPSKGAIFEFGGFTNGIGGGVALAEAYSVGPCR